EALVPSTKRLRIGRSNFRLPSNIQSKESTLHQNTQQYGAILPIELTNEDIRNTIAYKEYYACATGVAAPKPKASARKKRGDSDTSLTPPIATPTTITTAAPVPRITAAAKGKQPAKAKSSSDLSKAARTEAEQPKIVLRGSRQETHISQHGGSSTDEGTGSKPGFQMYHLMNQKKKFLRILLMMKMLMLKMKAIRMMKVMMKVMMEMMMIMMRLSKMEVTESDWEDGEKETTQEEEESFDPIHRTPEESEDDGNDEEDQGLSLSDEERIYEEEEAEDLYRDVNINQGRGLQVSQNIEDSHVTLTPVHPDGLQESSSV
nr:hypothetical protein [Tanacetum cinerariifolium]